MLASPAPAADPWADQVVSYSPGSGFVPGFTNPAVVLGEPERFTGEGVFPSAVTPFNAPFLPSEIVSVGAGGHLIVRFDEPITNDPSHLYGVDLLIFGNGFFTGPPVSGVFEEGPFTVSVSADGTTFVTISGQFFDALFPPLGYLDLTDPFQTTPGSVPSDFTRPVNPSLLADAGLGSFFGKTFAEVVALYDGSGGGIPIDIAESGLSRVFFVRVDLAPGAGKAEFDSFAAVPEPGTGVCGLILLSFTAAFRRK